MTTTPLSPLGRVAAADHTDTDPQYWADGDATSPVNDRPRFTHSRTGLEAEAVSAVVAITAGLLLSQYAQAVIDCGGDPAALRVYLPDGWADEAATILAAVFRG
jgi:hypothetical protein